MEGNRIIGEVRWERIASVAELAEARAWLSFQACRGLAWNTLDAYGRNLERYLQFLQRSAILAWEVKQHHVAEYLRGLLAKPTPSEAGDGDSTLANATVQQHLTTLRLFYDYLVEE